MLRAVAAALERDLRTEDAVARFGGDEFCIMLPHSNRSEAEQAVKRISEDILALRIDIGRDEPLRVSATFGLAELDDGHADGTELFEEADRALYRGKDTPKRDS